MVEAITLCGKGSCCPVVEILETEVRIGEEGNWVVLSQPEWNALVDKVKTGELKAL